MMEWREREHEDDNFISLNDRATVTALRQCGLLEIFKIQGMRAQLRLLEYLVHMWDVDQQVFRVGAHILYLYIEDIYLLIGLYLHGSHVTLTRGIGGGLPMSEYLRRYCDPEAERRKGKFAIRGVWDLPLQTIIFNISHMVGSASPHMALQIYFQNVIECMEPRVFNWSDGVLHSMKKQLTKCKRGDLKQFGYRSILVYFFLERVPHLCLQVEWGIPSRRDPRMKRWCDLMARHVVGPIVKYNDVFFG
jgi:hypothetical protein